MSAKLNQLLKEAASITKSIQKIVKMYERWEEEPEVGSVIKFDKTFGRGRTASEFSIVFQTYTYVAVRIGDQWFVTGSETRPRDWNEMVEFIGDSPAELVSRWETVSQA